MLRYVSDKMSKNDPSEITEEKKRKRSKSSDSHNIAAGPSFQVPPLAQEIDDTGSF